MKRIHRTITNISSDKLAESKDFYTQLFDLQIAFESDWFIQLQSAENNFELGIIKRDHEIVPLSFQQNPQGFYLTFVVENADQQFNIAQQAGFEVVQEPHDTFYGQRRLLLKDPDGALVDISSLIEEFSA